MLRRLIGLEPAPQAWRNNPERAVTTARYIPVTNYSELIHSIILNAADESRIRCILYDGSDSLEEEFYRNIS